MAALTIFGVQAMHILAPRAGEKVEVVYDLGPVSIPWTGNVACRQCPPDTGGDLFAV